jgi:leukotriene-A4 hydrolase
LKGKDPDDAFSSVPYEKGFVFLYHLEKLVGKATWDKFIPHYFTTFKFRSLDSYEFKATLLDFFASDKTASKALEAVDWDTWFYKPGFPPKPAFDTSLADACFELAGKWRSLTDSQEFEPKAEDIQDFTAQQSYVFLESLQSSPTSASSISPSNIAKMGDLYGYGGSQNVELVSRFYVLALQNKAEEYYQAAADLAGRVGRMKFVRPLYRELIRVDEALAKRTFERKKEFYHPICRGMVERLFEKQKHGGGEK